MMVPEKDANGDFAEVYGLGTEHARFRPRPFGHGSVFGHHVSRDAQLAPYPAARLTRGWLYSTGMAVERGHQ